MKGRAPGSSIAQPFLSRSLSLIFTKPSSPFLRPLSHTLTLSSHCRPLAAAFVLLLALPLVLPLCLICLIFVVLPLTVMDSLWLLVLEPLGKGASTQRELALAALRQLMQRVMQLLGRRPAAAAAAATTPAAPPHPWTPGASNIPHVRPSFPPARHCETEGLKGGADVEDAAADDEGSTSSSSRRGSGWGGDSESPAPKMDLSSNSQRSCGSHVAHRPVLTQSAVAAASPGPAHGLLQQQGQGREPRQRRTSCTTAFSRQLQLLEQLEEQRHRRPRSSLDIPSATASPPAHHHQQQQQQAKRVRRHSAPLRAGLAVVGGTSAAMVMVAAAPIIPPSGAHLSTNPLFCPSMMDFGSGSGPGSRTGSRPGSMQNSMTHMDPRDFGSSGGSSMERAWRI